jgi:hypothetical protein
MLIMFFSLSVFLRLLHYQPLLQVTQTISQHFQGKQALLRRVLLLNRTLIGSGR